MKCLYFFSAQRIGNYEGRCYECGNLKLDYKIDSGENYAKAMEFLTTDLKKKNGYYFGVTSLSLLHEEP